MEIFGKKVAFPGIDAPRDSNGFMNMYLKRKNEDDDKTWSKNQCHGSSLGTSPSVADTNMFDKNGKFDRAKLQRVLLSRGAVWNGRIDFVFDSKTPEVIEETEKNLHLAQVLKNSTTAAAAAAAAPNTGGTCAFDTKYYNSVSKNSDFLQHGKNQSYRYYGVLPGADPIF